MAIRYFSEDRSIPKFLKRRAVTAWLDKLAKAHQKSIAEINFIFCSDESLLQVNQEYLSHDYYTDIISFDNSNSDGLRGDIFISLDRVKDNAQQYGVSYEQELYRVICHGVLHFIGYKDKSEEESANMRAEEDKALKMLGLIIN
ncbi:MAG TPA: rRNA maturation RNase YbeY [Saprospiraceae bacterium]|nr:rRNA maturation RNase YbeY [Saprospiraceae bacterium]MCB9328963.1 rRNA maturation RNase YbeY [Lewinellaceae bacterium]HPK10356.1 rRNA maturation RNase YbeY [Saprospiraceae bacterium]HRX28763.1 rRNA maturation RNase YbeY [Saprospiraceae bacterium]